MISWSCCKGGCLNAKRGRRSGGVSSVAWGAKDGDVAVHRKYEAEHGGGEACGRGKV